MPVFLMPDISDNQGKDGLSAAAAKQVATVAKAIMVKATQDKGYTFEAFASSIAHARAAGLETAAYHFVGNSPGIEQAHHVWSVVLGSGVSAICIDWEGGSRQVALDLHATLKGIAEPHGIKVGAYEGSWAREHGGGLPGCDFTIIPAYGDSTLNPEYKQAPYAGWQYTNGVVNGTKLPSAIPGIGHCDVSVIERPELLGFKVTPPVAKKPAKPAKPKRHPATDYGRVTLICVRHIVKHVAKRHGPLKQSRRDLTTAAIAALQHALDVKP